MKRLFVIITLVIFSVCANGSYKLDMNDKPTLTTTEDIFGECLKESDREYCVLYTLGYLGYYTEEKTTDMDNFLEANADMFTGYEQNMVERLNKFFNNMLEDSNIGTEEAEYVCIISGAIGALYYASIIEKDLKVEDASRWAEASCKSGVAPFNISMYALNTVSYLSRL